jgi:hypothetical protein
MPWSRILGEEFGFGQPAAQQPWTMTEAGTESLCFDCFPFSCRVVSSVLFLVSHQLLPGSAPIQSHPPIFILSYPSPLCFWQSIFSSSAGSSNGGLHNIPQNPAGKRKGKTKIQLTGVSSTTPTQRSGQKEEKPATDRLDVPDGSGLVIVAPSPSLAHLRVVPGRH